MFREFCNILDNLMREKKVDIKQCVASLLPEASVCKRIICNGEGHVRGLGKNLLSKIVSIFFPANS